MLLAPAHSFTQQARLAITLAWIAGYTNILTFRACQHVTSHVSGTTSDLGLRLVHGEWGLAGFAVFLLATFFAGAVLSGIATELGRRRGWESIYVLPMAIEAMLLASLAIGIELNFQQLPIPFGASALFWLTGTASMAMGLQNATITRISSGVVRTTHVTGVLTDLGLEAVQFVEWLYDKRRDVPPGSARSFLRSAHTHPTSRRLALLLSILGSFALGAALGTIAYDEITRWAMFPPVFFLLWIISTDIRQPIAEIEPSDLVGTSGLGLPEALAVYHLRRDSARAGSIHRLPNLLRWVDALPPATRVVILDLVDVTQLDDNAAVELRAAINRLHSRRQHLLLAGIDHSQYEQLRRGGAADLLHPSNVCSDLELAIARGVNLVEDLAAMTSAAPR